uniref:alpha-1,2-Mannosidase n=1 Tax=Ditylum brightwellii TaxID=49249 RepID=A0A7S4T7X4_9STRA
MSRALFSLSGMQSVEYTIAEDTDNVRGGLLRRRFAVPPQNADTEYEDESDFPYGIKTVPYNHDFTKWKPPGGNCFTEYIEGDDPYIITKALKHRSDAAARTRREHIRNAMKHAWNGYKTHAFGKDEVFPQGGGGQNNWGGMGTTLVDALDTLWLMDMKDEFWEGRDWVRDSLNNDINRYVSVFETTIRSLGGLLSAYDLSGDKAFLDKADDLGSRLFEAFDTASGIPNGQVNLHTGDSRDASWTAGKALIAEFGTLQVEFRYLAAATGKSHYAEKSEHVFEIIKQMNAPKGLYPVYVQNTQKTPSFSGNHVTFGAMGDSVYEYMLKIWLQGGKKENMYREMWDKSIQGLHDELLLFSNPNGLTYIAEKYKGKLDHKMDHLACFMGGALALGAYTDPQGLESERAQRDLKSAKALAYTCYQMYARSKTGIAPEYVRFGNDNDYNVGHAHYYILRPETVETLFILNVLTGDPIYREWGWEIFQSIEKYCKTKIAYGHLTDVDQQELEPENRMESFFLAETMKYLYLLQDPDTDIDILNKVRRALIERKMAHIFPLFH